MSHEVEQLSPKLGATNRRHVFKLGGSNGRARVVVFACEVGGRWSTERRVRAAPRESLSPT